MFTKYLLIRKVCHQKFYFCYNMSFMKTGRADFSPPGFLVPSTVPDVFNHVQQMDITNSWRTYYLLHILWKLLIQCAFCVCLFLWIDF